MLLIVDDEVFSLEMINRKMTERGYGVIKASSECEAKFALDQAQDIDAIITDIHMFDGNGIALLKWIQIHHPAIKRFVLSAHTYEKAVMDARESGLVHHVFTKPVDFDGELVPILKNYLLE